MICKKNKTNIFLKRIDLKILKQNIEAKNLLYKDKSGMYIYESRQYKILHYKIKPRIFLTINYEDDSIEVICKKIDLNIHSNINSELSINIGVKIKRINQGIKLERVMELCIENEKSFKIIPKEMKGFLLDKVVSISSKRFDKRLTNKILELASYNSN